MTISVNPVAAAAVAAAPGANPAATAAGPLGGFEALMAALFGAEGLGASALAKTTLAPTGEGETSEGDAPQTDAASADPTAVAQSLLAALVAAPTAPANAPPAASEGAAATGWGPVPGVPGVTPPAGEKSAILQPSLPGQSDGLDAAPGAVAGEPPSGGSPVTDTPLATIEINAAAAPTNKPAGPPFHAQASQVAFNTPARAATAPTPDAAGDSAPAGTTEGEAQQGAAPVADATAAVKSKGPAQDAQVRKFEVVEPATAQPAAATEAAPEAPASHAVAETSAGPAGSTSPAAPTHLASLRGAPETVATLAAQILKKLDARTTRFDMELEPAGLGRVDVRLEIGAHGRLTAAMAFDNPQSAQELRSRASELARALEQAGFDVSDGLSFDVADNSGGSGQNNTAQEQAREAPWRGRAFQAALDTAAGADPAPTGALSLAHRRALGVDIRI